MVLVVIRVILNSAEALANRNDYAIQGVIARRPKTHSAGSRPDLRMPSRSPQAAHLFVVVLQCVCALVLLFPWTRYVTATLLTLLLALEFLARKHNFGGEGSDQMHFILVCALTLFFWTTDPLARTAVVWFVGLQSMLAYFTSGLVKLKAPPWKQGEAINLVLSTDCYGDERLCRLLQRVPCISRLMCWGVILFECGFPVAVLAGTKAALIVICCGAFFHLTIAVVMGLNGFLWTFVATYPAVFEFSREIQRLVHSRM